MAIGVKIAIVAVSLYMQYREAQAAKRKQKALMDSFNQPAGTKINTTTTKATIPLIYGENEIGGNFIYKAVSGSENEYLHLVVGFGEGEFDSLQTLKLDDKEFSQYGDKAYYEFFSGSKTQTVCTTLKNAVGENKWNDALRGLAYVYVRLKYDVETFSGIPKVTAIVKGRKVLDVRDNQVKYSTNPALCLYDLCTNKNALGLETTIFDIDTVKEVANFCDSPFSDTRKFESNWIVDRSSYALDTVYSMLEEFRGFMVYSDGFYRLGVYNLSLPVMTITANDIIEESFNVTLPSLQNTPNKATIRYRDKVQNYEENSVTIEMEGADDEERAIDISFSGITTKEQATLIGRYELERANLNRGYSFQSTLKTAMLEVGDVVLLTYSAFGLTNKLMRIESLSMGVGTDRMSVSVVEEDAKLYNDVLDLSAETYFTSDLPNPLAPPSSVQNVIFSEKVTAIKDNTYATIFISFDAPANPMWEYAEVWVSKKNNSSYAHFTDAVGKVEIANIADGDYIYIKFLSVSIYGVKQKLADVQEYSYEITGKNLPPADISSISAYVASSSVNLVWQKVDDIDLLYYEVKMGNSWNTSIYIGNVKGTSISLSGVRPGELTFLVKAVDSLHQYSNNPVSARVTTFLEKGWTETYSFFNNYASGTFVNMERVYLSGMNEYLARVSYQNSSLVGEYYSPVYDLGSILEIKAWLVLELISTPSSLTWESKFAPSKRWAEVLSSSIYWYKIYINTIERGDLEVWVSASEDGTNWQPERPNMHIYSCDFRARYLKYRIKLRSDNFNTYIYCKPATLKVAS